MSRVARVAFALTCLATATGCAHKRPYKAGQGPKQDELLALSKPQIDAIQVSKASVTLNRALRGSMAFIAQVPGRFRGGVSFAGAELVTLSLSEEGYQLRSIKGDLPSGFYEGPPDQCAVQALLGVTIETESLVSMLLGGIPLINAPFEVMGQKWSRKRGWELILIRNAQYIEELRYGWVDSTWQFVGGELWERNGDDKGRRLWKIEHKSMTRVDGAYLPSRTLVSTPGKRKDDVVTIVYKDRDTDPAFAKQSNQGGDDDDGGDDDAWGDDGAWDDGGDDGGWEDEGGDDGWEDGGETPEPAADGGAAAPAGEPPTASEPTSASETPSAGEDAPAPSAPGPSDAPAPNATAPAAPPSADATPSPIPKAFRLVPGTLVNRGDLCNPSG